MWFAFIALFKGSRKFVQPSSTQSRKAESRVPTLSFLSLQFRQPYLDLRGVLRSRTSLGPVEAMLGQSFNASRSLSVRDFPEL